MVHVPTAVARRLGFEEKRTETGMTNNGVTTTDLAYAEILWKLADAGAESTDPKMRVLKPSRLENSHPDANQLCRFSFWPSALLVFHGYVLPESFMNVKCILLICK